MVAILGDKAPTSEASVFWSEKPPTFTVLRKSVLVNTTGAGLMILDPLMSQNVRK